MMCDMDTNTNINKTKEEIIYELLLSLNKGDSYSVEDRVMFARHQYKQLVEDGIIVEAN